MAKAKAKAGCCLNQGVTAIIGFQRCANEGPDFVRRGFSCVDLRGHLWSVGNDEPWAAA